MFDKLHSGRHEAERDRERDFASSISGCRNSRVEEREKNFKSRYFAVLGQKHRYGVVLRNNKKPEHSVDTNVTDLLLPTSIAERLLSLVNMETTKQALNGRFSVL